ncbi:hypothetical protein P3T37_006450 [Kitasatospora sp. MAA4]|nr:hypothetical protein [Kitasatospora sp. MAA4]
MTTLYALLPGTGQEGGGSGSGYSWGTAPSRAGEA